MSRLRPSGQIHTYGAMRGQTNERAICERPDIDPSNDCGNPDPGNPLLPIPLGPKERKALRTTHGRPIDDASATDHGQIPLNSGNVKAQVDQLWGPIEHPTLSQLSQMVLDQAAATSWEDVVLWKIDLKGAFMLLFVHPASVCRLACFCTGHRRCWGRTDYVIPRWHVWLDRDAKRLLRYLEGTPTPD